MQSRQGTSAHALRSFGPRPDGDGLSAILEVPTAAVTARSRPVGSIGRLLDASEVERAHSPPCPGKLATRVGR